MLQKFGLVPFGFSKIPCQTGRFLPVEIESIQILEMLHYRW